jgi:hypothetical protein
MEPLIKIDDIKHKLTAAYINSTNPTARIQEFEECIILCDKLIENEKLEYNNLSYISKVWYLLHANNDIEKFKEFIEDCIINEKLKPLW